jgi:hypothetical protein
LCRRNFGWKAGAVEQRPTGEQFRRALASQQDFEANDFVAELDERRDEAIHQGRAEFSVSTISPLTDRIYERIRAAYPTQKGWSIQVRKSTDRIGNTLTTITIQPSTQTPKIPNH